MACPVFDIGITFYVDLLQEYPELSVVTTRGRCLFRDTGDELVRLPICVCLTKDVRKNVMHSFIQVWISWCRSTGCRGVMHGRHDRRWSSGIIVCSVELYSLVERSILRHSCSVVPPFVMQRCHASRLLGTLAAICL